MTSTAVALVEKPEIAPVPVAQPVALRATRASSDRELLASWLASLSSPETQRNFETTAERFLATLEKRGLGIRLATIEDVRDALLVITKGLATSSVRQYTLRVKSLLSYAHKLGYTPFNAGAAIRPPAEVRNLSKRIVGELDVRDLIRSSSTDRDHIIQELAYSAALRVSEISKLNTDDIIKRGDDRVQVHIVGKGRKERDILLPVGISRVLVAWIEGKGAGAPVFTAHRSKKRLGTRDIHRLVKRAAKRAGITAKISPHWLRHAHGSHSLDRGAPIHVVRETMGHGSLTVTTGYAHAKPDSSSADYLDPDVWSAPRKTE